MEERLGASPIQIDSTGAGPVVFTTEDMDRFVMTQREAVDAARAHQLAREDDALIGERFGAFLYRLWKWCNDNGVSQCVLSPRMDDALVVVVAPDEDEHGALHDRMSRFDLDCFKSNALRLSWLLLRASERDGIGAFVDAESARTVYRAQPR